MKKNVSLCKFAQYRLVLHRPKLEINRDEANKGPHALTLEKEKQIPQCSSDEFFLSNQLQTMKKTHHHTKKMKNIQENEHQISLQKQNKKIHKEEFHVSPKAMQNHQGRTKSVLCELNKKRLSDFPSKPKHRSYSSNQNIERDNICDSILDILIKKSSASIRLGMVHIKKSCFLNILNSVISFIVGQDHDYLNQENQKLKDCLKKLLDPIKILFRQNKKTKLSIHNQRINKKINPEHYQNEVQNKKQSIVALYQEEIKIKEKLKVAQEKLLHISQICSQKQQQFIECEQKSSSSKLLFQEYSHKYEILSLEITEKEKEIDKIKQQSEKIKTFVQHQEEWPLIKLISESYKKLEGEIFDYALYLQQNPYYSSLTFEPNPYSVVEQHMDQDMKTLNAFILREDESLESKSKRMRDFVLESMRKFKRKDGEMQEMNRLKTESIIKFVKMMQKWVENFELKEEHLGSLRKEFVVDSQEIDKTLGRVTPLLAKEDSQKLQKHWKNVKDNYKFGNYFY